MDLRTYLSVVVLDQMVEHSCSRSLQWWGELNHVVIQVVAGCLTVRDRDGVVLWMRLIEAAQFCITMRLIDARQPDSSP